MRTLVGSLLAFVSIAVTATPSRAIDVRNEDERSYTFTVTSPTMTRDITLNGLSLSIVVCVGECEFYVPGVGRTKARGNDTVAIRNGRLRTDHQEAAVQRKQP